MIYYMINRATRKPVLDCLKNVMTWPTRNAVNRYIDYYQLDPSDFRILEADEIDDIKKIIEVKIG